MSWHATLPSHAPPAVRQHTIYIRDPGKIQPVAEAERRREFNILLRRYIHQLLHGCQREYCDTPTCYTARKRRRKCREFTPLSARIIACQLATAEEPYKALCPGTPAAVPGRLVGDKVDQGLKDPRNFTQQLFDTVPLRKLEWLGLPLPSGILNFAPEGEEHADNNNSQQEPKASSRSSEVDVEPPPRNYVSISMSISTDPLQTPQHTQTSTFTAPHSPPPRLRRFERHKRITEEKLTQDLNSLLSSPTSLSRSATLPTKGNAQALPQPPRHHSIHLNRSQLTPSRTQSSSSIEKVLPSAPYEHFTTPPQSISHLNATITTNLLKMCEDPKVSSLARNEAVSFVRQSLWYVFTTPDAIDGSFVLPSGQRDEIFNMHPLNIDSALRLFMERRWSREIFHALWKAVGELFPKVIEPRDPKGKRAVKPSSISEKLAAKIVILSLHALAASLPKLTPEVWEETRRTRSRGQVSHHILIEDDLGMRLTCRLVRALASYRLFAPGIMAHLKQYFSFCGVILDTERRNALVGELGSHLGNEVAASGVGKGGWSLATCTLEWARAVMLSEWDGEEVMKKGSIVEGAVGMIKFLYANHEAYGLDQEYFQNQILADRLDPKDTPVEWYQSTSKLIAKSHLLDHPFLFPPSALVTFFRSINFHLMSNAYDTAVSKLRFIHQIASYVTLQSYLQNSLFKRSKVSMSMYLLLEVKRETVVQDALNQLIGREHRECTRPLKVRFLDVGEEGLDHGGVQQEFFSIIWSEILKPELGVFTTDPTTHLSWFSITPLEPLHKIELLGVLVSLAVYNGVTLPISFPKALYRKLLGYRVNDIEHIEDGWPDLARGLRLLLKWDEEEGDVKDIFMRSYEFSFEAWGQVWNVDMRSIDREAHWDAPVAEKLVKKDEKKIEIGECPQLPEDLIDFGTDSEEVHADDELGSSSLLSSLANDANEEAEEDAEGEPNEMLGDVEPAVVSQVPDEAPDESSSDDNGITTPPTDESHDATVDATDDHDSDENEEENDDSDDNLVTNANRHTFISDYIYWLTHKSIQPQYEAFERGFRSCLDPKALSLFNPASLQQLVEGTQDIDVAALEAATRYDDGYSANHKLIKDFWSIVRTYSPERKRQLLEFVTASDRVPVNGIGSVMFVIQRNGPDNERVPTSLTCFGRLLLPEYSSKKRLREKLKLALENGKGFGVP